jgi:hypothetical protein
MLLDKQAMYSDDQAVTADAASTNVIDHGAPATPPRAGRAVYRDMGRGVPIPVLLQVTETFVAADATMTLVVKLQVDNDEAFGSATEVVATAAIAKASLVAGYQIPLMFSLPHGMDERYSRLYYDVTSTTSITAGKITAGIVAGGLQSHGEAAAFRSA